MHVTHETVSFKYFVLIFLGLLAIVSGVYFVFAAPEDRPVTITAYVSGDAVEQSPEVSTNSENELGWSYGHFQSPDSANKEDVVDNSFEDVSKEPGKIIKPAYRGVSFLSTFSVMVYWYRRDNPPENVDLNQDGRINIIDFSIFAFNSGLTL